MGFITTTIKKIISSCQSFLNSLFERKEDWQEKITSYEQSYDYDDYDLNGISEFDSLHSESDASQKFDTETIQKYAPEYPDVDLANKCRNYIVNKFPNGFFNYLNNSSVDQRVDDLRNFTFELSEVFGVKLNDVILYVPETDFQKNSGGYYSPSDNSVYINISLLFSNNNFYIKEAFIASIHELKHARQWAAVNHWKDYGYSNELIYRWNYNWNNYTYPEESDEGYRKQPLEFDAFEFSKEVGYLFSL